MIRSIVERIAPAASIAIKEIRQVLRQPRLIGILVVGPFLILGLFGLGYRERLPPFETLLVLPPDSELADQVDELEEALEPAIEFVGVVSDRSEAIQLLREREVDAVVVAPEDAIRTIRNDEHVDIDVFHDRLDPFDRVYIEIFSRASIDELNRAVLEDVAATAQARIDETADPLPEAAAASSRLTDAIEDGDPERARAARTDVVSALSRSRLSSESDLLDGLERQLGISSDDRPSTNELRQRALQIDPEEPGALEQAQLLEESLNGLEEFSGEVTGLSPAVLVRPFVADPQAVVGHDVDITNYYAPAVLIVLLQHIIVTFGALSLVREQALGTTELLRASPITSLDLLVGKYVGYAVIGVTVSALLMAGLVLGFGTPQNGSWAWMGGVVALTLLASLGLGFAIATVSDTDAQAVQNSMMVLLFTIFFSGFVLSLERLATVTQVAAYFVPATYGIGALQDVMFRGETPRVLFVIGLAAYAVAGFAVAYVGLRRRIAR